jgi:hypothetical protein
MDCYLCGQPGITADHIPPKGFFPSPRPSNLITVSCCHLCNESFSKDDEAVRAWFSSVIGRSEAGDWIFEKKVVRGTAVKSPAFREKMLSSMEEITLMSDVGPIEATKFCVDEIRIEKFLVRCTKGLLRHYYPEYDYKAATFRVIHVPNYEQELAKLEGVKRLLRYDERGNGVFQFRHGLTDSKQSGIWLFVFYEAVIYLVAHSKTNFSAISSDGAH